MLRTCLPLALFVCTLPPLRAAAATVVLSADGLSVADSVNGFTWLADGNMPASTRFGLPVCNAAGPSVCVNSSGSMSYQSAQAWVAAMNAANYLGHNNWQIPATPLTDSSCDSVGSHGASFGFNCSGSSLGFLYYSVFGLSQPNTAVPIPATATGPFRNLQPYFYWSGSPSGTGNGNATFSFNTGFQGADVAGNFEYVWPMIAGQLPGAPAATGTGLQVSPDGQTVYDPMTSITWLANANLGATSAFGQPQCTLQNYRNLCVAEDGSMNVAAATQFVANMNAGTGYLGHTDWQLPVIDASCTNYNCVGAENPMGTLFYDQLGFGQGVPAAAVPNIPLGPFHNFQPYLYWACEANNLQSACAADGPNTGFQFSFSFGDGFTDTDIYANNLYVTAYFVGTRTATTGPVVAETANAEGESPVIAPNTWVELKGANLAPAGDSRVWQASDFVGTQMPTQLDKVSATVNGKNAYIYYISPSQVNILTPPDAMSGPVNVVLTNNGSASASFTAQAQPLSPSFFVFGGGPYVAAVHTNGAYVGPTALYPGATTPAKPGETIMLYANGFGQTNVPVVSGSIAQSGTLSTLPAVTIGGLMAKVTFVGLVAPGEFQFNVEVPLSLSNGDQIITATYGGASTQSGALITIQN